MIRPHKLQELIERSSLPENDKKIWLEALENAPPEILAVVYGLVLDYGSDLNAITDFLKRLLAAVKNKNAIDWNSILRDEELFLNKANS